EPQSGALTNCAIGTIYAPEGTRTPGPLLRRQLLYPAELRARMVLDPLTGTSCESYYTIPGQPCQGFAEKFVPAAAQKNSGPAHRPARPDCRKKSKSVSVGGHAPTTETPPGKFCGKLCARNKVTSARFAVKFCRRGFQKGKQTR